MSRETAHVKGAAAVGACVRTRGGSGRPGLGRGQAGQTGQGQSTGRDTRARRNRLLPGEARAARVRRAGGPGRGEKAAGPGGARGRGRCPSAALTVWVPDRKGSAGGLPRQAACAGDTLSPRISAAALCAQEESQNRSRGRAGPCRRQNLGDILNPALAPVANATHLGTRGRKDCTLTL